MAVIDDVIKIQITRQDITVLRTGFDIPLIIGDSLNAFPSIVKAYYSLDEVVEDFEADTPEYIMATRIFAQVTSPDHILVTQQLELDTKLEAYNLAKTINPNFYAVLCTSKNANDVFALADQIQTETRIYGTSSSSADIANGADNNLLRVLSAADFSRTFLMYHTEAATEMPEAALLGKMLATTPGAETWIFQNLIGVTGNNLTPTVKNNLRLDKGIYYSDLAGKNVTLQGWMTNGTNIDIIHGLDWLESYIKENLVVLLRDAKRIPYTDAGIGLFENSLRASLQEAVNRGVILNYTVTLPKAITVSSEDKTARILRNVNFTATLAGAIHSIDKIVGVITD
jgi:hypothetical protein